MKKIKLITTSAIVMFFCVQTAFASWWNPFSWDWGHFFKKSTPTESVFYQKTQKELLETESQKNVIATVIENTPLEIKKDNNDEGGGLCSSEKKAEILFRNDINGLVTAKNIEHKPNVGSFFRKEMDYIYLMAPSENPTEPFSVWMVQGVDTPSFEYLKDGFYKDKNNLYYLSTRPGSTYVLERITGVDMETFSYFFFTAHGYNDLIIKDKCGVYFYDKMEEIKLFSFLDPVTFQVLDGMTLRDKNGEYLSKREWDGRAHLTIYKK
jgi:hypothetical protein